jgi:amino acid adenylation domain-containing protein/non-ribosomal peptide synthase protein (TIGR01720 family)
MSDLWDRIASLPPERAQLLARVLREKGVEAPAPPLIRADRSTDTFPLSFFQQNLWFFDQLHPGNSTFNIGRAIRWGGTLDVAALQFAIDMVVCRHEVLRVSFESRDGAPVQIVNPEMPIAVALTGLTEVSDNHLLEFLTAQSRKPFRLSSEPLLRVSVIQLSEQDHVVLFVIHHICTDAWSSGILVREIAAFYKMFVIGAPAELPELPIQYTDYSVWQRAWLQEEALESHLDFWRKKLAGCPPFLELPTDRPRPAHQTFNGDHIRSLLPPASSQSLNLLAAQHQCTPFMVFLSAWAALLYRYTGESGIVVGTPFANRNREEVMNLVGYFVNPVALRIDVRGRGPFADLLAAVRHCSIEAFSHAEVPFDRIVDALAGDRTTSHPPLFQTALVVQNAPVERFDVPGVDLSVLGLESGSSKLDLTVTVNGLSGSFALALEYNTDLFDRSTAERILTHYSRLLESIAADPHQPIDTLEYQDREEKERVLEHWSAGPFRSDEAETVLDLFERQVRQNGEPIALECSGVHWSYSQLEHRANQLGRYLGRLGVGPESIVGICCGRNPELVLGLLGVWKAGGAYTILDEKYPEERWRLILEDAKSPIVLCTLETAPRLMGISGDTPLLLLDAQWEEIERESADAPLSRRQPEGIAYVVYTSGSSGTPRGVIITDSALANLVRAIIPIYGLGPEQRRLQLVSPGFDAFGEELFPLLCSGGTLVLGYQASGMDPADWVQVIRDERISAVHMPPSYWHELVEDVERCEGRVPEILKLLVVGAESPSADQLLRWSRLTSDGARWMNAYGPAEATITTTVWEAPLEDEKALRTLWRVPIGRPIANTKVYLLDPRMEPVATGIAGELYIAGRGLARGYLNLPSLTAERFVPDPFSKDGAPLYRTGDLARFTPDGNIEFLGRKDEQVKVRGYRIELGEIEAVLREHRGVREAIVDARQESTGEKRLAAYIVPAYQTAPSSTELRSWLKQRLPEYMVPSAWVQLTELPRTAHGKVDRKALPCPVAAVSPEANQTESATDTEKTLLRIWREVLRSEHVGVHDNFFELGGDSILSIQIASRAQNAGVRITVKQLFEHQTISELAAVAQSADAAEPIDQGRVTGTVELTPIQQWFFEQNWREPWHFNQAVLLEAREPLSEEGLRAAVSALVEHHDALRTRFERLDGNWTQEVLAETGEDPLTVEAVTGAEQLEQLANEWQKRFDLAGGLLLRVVLFRMQGGSGRVLLIAHHLVVDGVSWRVLLEDLERAYLQWRENKTVQLPAKTASFQRWAELLKERAASSEVEAEWPYWRQQCTAGADRDTADHSVASLQVSLDADETRSLLQEVPPIYGTQINDALLTALVESLGTCGELTVELESHGRYESLGLDVMRTVGWFTTQYPVHLGSSGADGIAAKLKTVKEQLRQVPGGGLCYGLLRYLSRDKQRRKRLDFHAPVSFNYLGQLDSALPRESLFQPARERKGATRSSFAHASYPIMVNSQVSGGRLHVAFTYRKSAYTAAQMEDASARFLGALRTIVEHCHSPEAGGYTPSDFPLATLTQETLDQWFKGPRTIEDVYPLSPMQQGLLFHGLLDPAGGAYLLQISWSIAGLDLNAFAQAWQQVIDRHAILRTSFLWEGLGEPLQVVHKRCEVPIEHENWTMLMDEERNHRLSETFAAQRTRGFDFGKAPLMRIHVIQTDADTCRIVWAFHHLLMDGWSGANLMNEVFTLYVAHVSGMPAQLPPPFVYSSYIHWTRSRDLEASEKYWREELAGFHAPTLLGMQRHVLLAPADVQERIAVVRRTLSNELSAALHDCAKASGLTLNTIFQGAWALVLSCYSGESDVLFGATTAGRPPELPGIENAVGLFINTLPVRVRIAHDQPLVEWLRELQLRQSKAREWEHTPLLKIQSWSEVSPGNPLFESLLVLERYPTEAAVGDSRPNVAIGNPLAEERTHYPLTFEVVPSTNIQMRLGYERRRFDDASIVKVLELVTRFLQAFVAEPARLIGSLPLVSDDEQHDLVENRNAATQPLPDRLFHQLFEEQVEKTPHCTAVHFENEGLSYSVLNRQANRIAHRLVERGVGPEALVTVLAPRGTLFLSAILGVFKSGAAYLPLEPSLPPIRIAQILAQSGSDCVLVTGNLAALLSGTDVPIITLEDIVDGVGNQANLPLCSNSRNLAYVIYTSGSTGIPKGAMVEQAGMLNHLLAKVRDLGIHPVDTVAQTASHSFDISVWQYLAALLTGACVRIYPAEVAQDAIELWRRVAQDGVTILELVPPLMRAILQTGRVQAPNLRWLIATGEALPVDITVEWLNRYPQTPVMNAYGPTECSDDVTHAVVCNAAIAGTINVPIGLPIGNLRVYILDSALRLVPAGVSGELCIAGVGVGRGYLDDTARTSEVFVPDPFDGSGGRMYRTGDLARYTLDGQIEFLHRIDQQVKVRGHRIELGEVESALRGHADVNEAAVLVHPGESGGRMVAYIIGTPDISQVRKSLRDRLPAYMIPAAFVQLEALPLLPSGKLDRRALALIPVDAGAKEREAVQPRSPVERVIADIWAQLLRVRDFDIHDNFFELGGHSLTATQLVSRIRETFGVEIPLRAAFDAPTIEGLSEVLLSLPEHRLRIERTAELLLQVSELSDDQLETLMASAN